MFLQFLHTCATLDLTKYVLQVAFFGGLSAGQTAPHCASGVEKLIRVLTPSTSAINAGCKAICEHALNLISLPGAQQNFALLAHLAGAIVACQAHHMPWLATVAPAFFLLSKGGLCARTLFFVLVLMIAIRRRLTQCRRLPDGQPANYFAHWLKMSMFRRLSRQCQQKQTATLIPAKVKVLLLQPNFLSQKCKSRHCAGNT